MDHKVDEPLIHNNMHFVSRVCFGCIIKTSVGISSLSFCKDKCTT